MPIVMYGADWSRDCLRSKAVFERRAVTYDYVDIQRTPEAAAEVLRRNDGVHRIPVIVFEDDSHLVAPSDVELAAKLDQLGSLRSRHGDQGRFEVVELREDARFELHRDGEMVGFAVSREQEGILVLSHVETLAEHRNQGYGDRLMEGIVEIVRLREQTIVPLCWFAAGFLRDHPEHHDVLHQRS